MVNSRPVRPVPVSGVIGVTLGVNAYQGDVLPPPSSQIRISRIWDNSLTWGDLQPHGPLFHEKTYARLKRTALSAVTNGMRPLFVLWGTPRWAAPGCAVDERYGEWSCPVAPADMRSWSRFVYDVAYELADPKYLVDGLSPAFEVWNEPNDESYWKQNQPTRDDADRALVTMSRLAFDRVKAAARDRAEATGAAATSASVVCCGWARTGYPAMGRWLRLGGADHVDAISYHPYPKLAPDEPADGSDAASITRRFMGIVSGHLGPVAKPLWATETGANNCATDIAGPCITYTAQQQADVVASTLHAIRTSGVSHVIWYPWGDSGTVSTTDPKVQRLGLAPVLDAVVHGVPTAPTLLQVTDVSPAALVQWEAAADGADDGNPATAHGVVRYNVHRSTIAGFSPGAANRIAQPATTSHVDMTRRGGVTYYYKVTAQDAAGRVGAPSEEAAAFAARPAS